VEEGKRVQWAGGAAIEQDASEEKNFEVDSDEVFHINVRLVTARQFNEELEYYPNIAKFFPFYNTRLVFNIEQLTHTDYCKPKFDFYNRKKEVSR
jgi:hypothetical protein